jgi:2-C-methyl-D-erythritol 4-phosphate cytidylyltransferase
MARDTAAILVCAGNATRMGGIHKILHPLGDSTVLHEVLKRFAGCERIAQIIVVCRAQDTDEFRRSLSEIENTVTVPVTVVSGGDTRQQSVHNGFAAMNPDTELVAIHDGARPLIMPEDITKVIEDADKSGAATLGVPVKDTVKVVHGGIIEDTPDRASLWLTQTPQVFRRVKYAEAVKLARQQGKDYTDDCQLMEALGIAVTMTCGSYSNMKLTTPEDFAIAEALLARQKEGN